MKITHELISIAELLPPEEAEELIKIARGAPSAIAVAEAIEYLRELARGYNLQYPKVGKLDNKRIYIDDIPPLMWNTLVPALESDFNSSLKTRRRIKFSPKASQGRKIVFEVI